MQPRIEGEKQVFFGLFVRTRTDSALCPAYPALFVIVPYKRGQ